MTDRADLDAIRRIDPVRALDALGVRYRRVGGSYLALCVAHSEKHPSMSVASRDGAMVWHCQSCKAGGDFLAFVAAVRGLQTRRDFPKVVEEAAQIAGVTLTPSSVPARNRQKATAAVVRLAQRIDDLADAWLRGRDIKRDLVLEAAPLTEIADAFELLADMDDVRRAEDELRDREMDRLADEYEARCSHLKS